MMRDGGPDSPSLDFLPEPALLIDPQGGVRHANTAAHAMFGDALTLGQTVFADLVHEPAADVAVFLRQASRSTSPHLGSLSPRSSAPGERLRAQAARMRQAGDAQALVIVRLLPSRDEQFTALNRRLQDMDQQLHLRRKENASLQEALAENKVLLNELQHRVKNNIQQMLALIKMAAKGRRTPEVTEVIATASDRLRTMSITQEALYRNAAVRSLSSKSFMVDIAVGATASYGGADRLVTSIDDLAMTPEEAHCLALIANELITNACKYGRQDGAGIVTVSLFAEQDEICLEVRDNGPGFVPTEGSCSSGLLIVKALARQIGARFDMIRDDGMLCRVLFRSDLTPDGSTSGH